MEKTSKIISRDRDQWTSEKAFVFSMAAAAVGLGNIWRFPYMAGENGGGAFIIAYLTCLAVIVLPVMMLEVGAGRLAAGNTVHTFRQVNRLGTAYGWFVVLLTTVITSYYLVITGWTLGYAVAAWRFDIPDFSDFTAGNNSLWYFMAVTVIAAGLLMYGVKAIEKLSKFLMPALLALIITLVFIAARTSGWEEAKTFLLEADFSRLGESRLWIFALGQAFYSMAIGQGYLVTYGSYIPTRTNIPRACLLVAGTETSVALLAGFMIFPFVFTFGLQPDEGTQLAFSTLPSVFNNMANGAVLGILFFSLFFTAAFSSCLAGLKVIISSVSEELKIRDRYAVAVVAVVMIILGIPSALSFTPVQLTLGGKPFLDVIDQFGGTNVVIFSGIFGATLFCWFVPAHRVETALGARSKWWVWRIYIVGRALPALVLAWLGWLAIAG